MAFFLPFRRMPNRLRIFRRSCSLIFSGVTRCGIAWLVIWFS
jgi:hypothetical protein